ncbi:tRNA (N6-isopentenyl adenosine(37)-C2)-methylthiotransferase MiaB [Corynebacterium pseudodiphtheriticum]|uniref:tRNA (N6-isopentenyl adenosine(37)-C2)-methylthiotransferase MiaB n=1 Tax=Corynebacterium pseudodiphtheriticum TaxID=37637 RepID=UPI0025411EA2|nr:tRNA (N6-isopentenyl adenosine(37)-C2)-methylthiotransferase MiaB [Corynebacterium pseudodiphtheriticum]MDK4321005.1 tRNA (N6-isopentenyl adenosine(37)-C2)-methylthiotransferase MiaB [Corynebacterium pseudodiphtheriticum]
MKTEQSETSPRTYEVRTFGCQMNVHDSERLAGLLEDAGYVSAAEYRSDKSTDSESKDSGPVEPDLIVFNTCAVRENADQRLYGTLGNLKKTKQNHPGMQIAVGGCLAQKDKDAVLDNAPWVDAVFGTHNMGSLPTLLERARHNEQAQVEIVDALEDFPSVLPAKRESAYSGWVSISVGCNNTCTFCIVPSLRGKEIDRRPGDILAEVEALVQQGVSEVTLLGQNVNAYGVNFVDPELKRDRSAFSKLLAACAQIEGLDRLRFTSPHPAEFTSDVIDVMAEYPVICPQLHMPLQSGSDKVLKDMRRSYRSKKFMKIVDEAREKILGAAITTDIIVGFPGETEEDFQATMDVVRRARFSSAFTFQYSPRPGTPAAEMEAQVPKEVVQDRFERLVALQDEIMLEDNRALVGTEVELLVQASGGRKNDKINRLSGRARDGRLVHFSPRGDLDGEIRPGDVVTTTITAAKPYFLIADGGVSQHRRTKAGDMSSAGKTPSTAPVGVSLGLPTVSTRSN